MVQKSNVKFYLGEEDDIAEIPRAATRSDIRQERIKGLEIKNLDVPIVAKHSRSSSNLKTPKRRMSSRRSFVSLFTKSTDFQASKDGSASRSNQLLTPPMSPILWRTSNPSSLSLMSESSSEDLTTYRAHLAHFKSERAERAAELGINNCDSSSAEPSRLEKLQDREEHSRKSSGLSLGRGLRVYWGGGESSESRDQQKSTGSKGGLVLDPGSIDRVDIETLKDWWDRLGDEEVVDDAEDEDTNFF